MFWQAPSAIWAPRFCRFCALPVIALFVLAFAASMGMGYAGRLDSTASWVNWLEQGINIVSQGCLLAGVLILHCSGMKNASPR